jgi:hypothetical protein
MSDQASEETVKRNTKVLLLAGAAILIFMAVMAVIFFRFFNIANIVSGGR